MICMKNNKGLFGTAICICLLIGVITVTDPAAVQANVDPRMVDILITSNPSSVLLYARLVDCFKPEMETAILAGVPAVFKIQLDVYRERSYLWDKPVISKEIRRTIKYDNLKKTFSVTTNGVNQPAIFQTMESAQKAMADLNGITVVPISLLAKGATYYTEMKVKIDKVRLPFNMEYVFFFVSLWDFETPLYKVRFAF